MKPSPYLASMIASIVTIRNPQVSSFHASQRAPRRLFKVVKRTGIRREFLFTPCFESASRFLAN